MKIDVIDVDGKTMYATIEDATAAQVAAYSNTMEIRIDSKLLHVSNVVLYHESQILHIEVDP